MIVQVHCWAPCLYFKLVSNEELDILDWEGVVGGVSPSLAVFPWLQEEE